MVGSVPDFACFVGMVLRFHDELSIRQQFNAQKGAYKMAGTCFSGIINILRHSRRFFICAYKALLPAAP
ncbi:hypothetical protein, partial [Yersinia pseudotuberculosis]|uniref:hypothetical protein n=1 Tax=Yersinia pseudotuberculosis TaxID=633 RepID=UPI00114722B0